MGGDAGAMFCKVNSMARAVLLTLALTTLGCAHGRKVYIPSRCIQKVKWSEACEAISDSQMKCDGVMVTVSCVSVTGEKGGRIERGKFEE